MRCGIYVRVPTDDQKEEKFIARRKEGPTSVLVKKLDRFIPEKLSGTLNAAFFKGFQVIFENQENSNV